MSCSKSLQEEMMALPQDDGLGGAAEVRVRRLPGRDIPISDDEEDEDDRSKEQPAAITIQVIEDDDIPQLRPRRSSMVNPGFGLDLAGSKTTSSCSSKKVKITQVMVDEAKASSCEQFERRRSVSFTPEHVIIGDQESPEPSASEPKLTELDGNEESRVQDEMDRLMITSKSQERRKSIERVIRPPTPPNVSHRVRNACTKCSRESLSDDHHICNEAENPGA